MGEPEGAATAECALTAARAAGDEAAAAAAELHLMAALLRGQYGPARVDEAAGTITLQVGAGTRGVGGDGGAERRERKQGEGAGHRQNGKFANALELLLVQCRAPCLPRLCSE